MPWAGRIQGGAWHCPPLADIAHWQAPSHWRHIDCLSDVHLHEADAATRQAWQATLRDSDADAWLILGDLFEVWVGDDQLLAPDLPPWLGDGLNTLREQARQRPVLFMSGNRDFLIGSGVAQATGLQLLPDPTLLDWNGHRWLLSHGDPWCLDDQAYQQFRQTVRSPSWQQQFLAQPLAQRQAQAREMRARSQQAQQGMGTWADVDTALCEAVLNTTGAQGLLHGHTHRPGVHTLPSGRLRVVLSDWQQDQPPYRGDVIRLTADGGWERRPVRRA